MPYYRNNISKWRFQVSKLGEDWTYRVTCLYTNKKREEFPCPRRFIAMVCECLKKRGTQRKSGHRLCNAFSKDDGFVIEPPDRSDNSRVTLDRYFNCFRQPRPIDKEDFLRLFTKEENLDSALACKSEDKVSSSLVIPRNRKGKHIKQRRNKRAKREKRYCNSRSKSPIIKLDKIPTVVILEIYGFMGNDDLRGVCELSWKKRWFRLDFESALSDNRILEGSAVIWGNVVDARESKYGFARYGRRNSDRSSINF